MDGCPAIVHQAQGVGSAQAECSLDEAISLLQNAADATDTTLIDVAQEVVARRVSFSSRLSFARQRARRLAEVLKGFRRLLAEGLRLYPFWMETLTIGKVTNGARVSYRVEVYQAQGMVSVQSRCSTDCAMARMETRARVFATDVEHIAHLVVARTIRFGE